MALGCYLVILPRIEIDVSHPCSHIAGLRFHCHKSAVHLADHIANGVHRTDFTLYGTVGRVVGEELHSVRLIHVEFDGVGLIRIFLLQNLMVSTVLGYIFDEIRDFSPILIAPRRSASPMLVETLLQNTHLLENGFFGILLQASVNSGIYLQAISIEVDVIFLAPIGKEVLDFLTEILCLSVVSVLNIVSEFDRQFRDGVIFLLGETAIVAHVVENHIPSRQTVFRIHLWIVSRSGFQQTNQCGTLLRIELVGSCVEIGFGSRLDAKGIATEIDCVEIKREDVLLAIEILNLDSSYPFLRLHDEHLQHWHSAKKPRGILRTHLEKVFHELLRDGTGTSCIALKHILESGEKSSVVDAMMQIETFVLGTYQCIDDVWRYFLKLHRRTVLVEILAYQHAVGTINKGCFVVDRILDAIHVGRLAEQSEQIYINGSQIEEEKDYEGGNGSDQTLIPTSSILSFVPKPCKPQPSAYFLEYSYHG